MEGDIFSFLLFYQASEGRPFYFRLIIYANRYQASIGVVLLFWSTVCYFAVAALHTSLYMVNGLGCGIGF